MKMIKPVRMATCIAAVFCTQMLLAADQSDQSQTKPWHKKDRVTQNLGIDGVRLGKLKGADVKSSDGQDLGKLEDVVIDRKTGQIAFAIVGKGGVMGVGEKPHPVPWQEVTINSEKQITLNVDKNKMDSAPTTTSDYSDLNNPDAVLVIYKFYEIPTGAGESPGGVQQSPGQGSSQSPSGASEGSSGSSQGSSSSQSPSSSSSSTNSSGSNP
jgi:sporulation protein YlmC with PRC-barrel domain